MENTVNIENIDMDEVKKYPKVSSLFIEQKLVDVVQIKGTQKNVNLSRNLKTVALSMAYFIFGYDLIIYGLALPTLAENMKKTVSELSPAVVARGAGFLSGSLTVGLANGRMDIELVVSLAMSIMSIGLVFVPIILNFASLIVFSFISSFGLGAFETVGNVFCIKLWGEQAQTILQILHFFFCLGCLASPLTAKYFLNEPQNTTLNNGSVVFRDVIYVGGTNLPYVSIIYIIIAGLGFCVSLYFFFLKFYFKTASSLLEEEPEKEINKWFRHKILVFMFFLFLLYVGAYLTVTTFLYTFAVSDIPGARYTKHQASNLNTVYLVGDTVGQFLSIFMAKKFSARFNITLNMTVVLVCSIGLLFFPYYTNYAAIFWVLMAIHGLFLPSIYGFFYSWANKYIAVNERASCIFIIAGSCGEMVLPLLLGIFIDAHPMYFLYFICTYIFLALAVFLFGNTVAKNTGSKYKRRKPSDTNTEIVCLETQT